MQLDGFLIDYTPVSLSFYHVGATQRVAIGFGSYYQVYVDSCTVIGCDTPDTREVALPTDWWINALLKKVDILGIGENLHVGFIGNSFSTPISTDQVYYTFDAFDGTAPERISFGLDTSKYDLQMVRVNARPESTADHFAVVAWGELSSTKYEFFIYDGILNTVKVHASNCVWNLPGGEIGSNGFYVSGVWDNCGNTMFSTQAWATQLPMIVK